MSRIELSIPHREKQERKKTRKRKKGKKAKMRRKERVMRERKLQWSNSYFCVTFQSVRNEIRAQS